MVLWRSLTLAVGIGRVEVEGKLVVSSLQEQQQLREEDRAPPEAQEQVTGRVATLTW